jgi:hypothetical protein
MLSLRYFLIEHLLIFKRGRRPRDPGIFTLVAPGAKANAEEVEEEDDQDRRESSQHQTMAFRDVHMRSTSATRASKRSTVRVRFEIQIGVNRVCVRSEPPASDSLFAS